MRYVIFFAVALVVMGGAHYYVWARLVRDAELPGPWPKVVTIAIALLFAILMSGFVLFRVLSRNVAAPISWVSFTWLGLLFFLVLSLGVTDLARVVTLAVRGARHTRAETSGPNDPERRLALSRIFGGAAAVLGLGTSGAAMASALSAVQVRKVKVAVDRLAPARAGYRIVQISDVHVGPTIGRGFIEDVVARINALEPDVIAITGDLVDGSVEELREHVAPLAKLRAKDGVFFVTGNHEYYSGAEDWVAHLGVLGVRVLRNEHVQVGGPDGIDIAGIDDWSSRGLAHGHGPDLAKALGGRDATRPVVLLAHQPRGIEIADELGVDLQLSGHTHGGQIFPWNFLVKLQQPFIAGLHKLARAQIYVSCGTGYWGPPMRLGAPAEITHVELVPKSTVSS